MTDIDEILKDIREKTSGSIDDHDGYPAETEDNIYSGSESFTRINNELSADYNIENDFEVLNTEMFSKASNNDAGAEITEEQQLTEKLRSVSSQKNGSYVTPRGSPVRGSPVRGSPVREKIKHHNRFSAFIRMLRVNSKSKPKQRRTYIVGMFTVAASLITMGAAMLASLFSPAGLLNALKITPIILVFFGIEIVINIIAHKSTQIRFNGYALIICLTLIAFTFAMSAVSLVTQNKYDDRYYVQEKLAREIEAVLYEDFQNITDVQSVEANVVLYGDELVKYWDSTYIKENDTVDLKVKIIPPSSGVHDFAVKCEEMLQIIEKSGYLFKNVLFEADDGIKHFQVQLDGYYQTGLTAAELTPMVGYVGMNIEADIPDLED